MLHLLSLSLFLSLSLSPSQFLHKLIRHSRSTAQGQYQDFLIGPSLSVTARRTHLYEDAFNELSAAGKVIIIIIIIIITIVLILPPLVDGLV